MAKSEEKRPRGRPRGSKIDPFRAHVGVLTDAEVAAMAGVSISAVKLYRDRNKIAPALPQGATRRARDRKASPASEGRPAAPPERKGPGRKSRIAPLHHLVGVIADADVAKQAGVTANAVQMYRKKHGIPASGIRASGESAASSGGQATAAAPKRRGRPPGRRPAGGTLYGWRLRIASGRGGEEVRIALAADAAAACAAGSRAGEVVGIERLALAMG
jgi:hypothetical protein